MNKPVKPAIVPTLLSSQVLAWSTVLIIAFALALWIYNSCSAIAKEKQIAAEPVTTTVEGPAITCVMPKGWMAYSKSDDVLRMRKSAEARLPFLEVASLRDEMAPYRALDTNPALIVRKLVSCIAADLPAGTRPPDVIMHGIEQGVVKPGVPSLRFIFSTSSGETGYGIAFYNGERRYFVWGMAASADSVGRDELAALVMRAFESIRIPDAVPEIDRPIVNSGRLTAEGNRQTLKSAERELAMWRLFSEREKTEPASALLPALQHFREAVRLLSSVRQEKGILSSPDFRRYRELLAKRRETLREWFVLLDKYRAMRDFEAAKKQANYIIEHATLTGEGPESRRAHDALAEIEAALQH